MNHVLKPKRSDSAGNVPTTSNLEEGEIAINLADKKLFVRDTSNNILELTSRTLTSLEDVYLSGESDSQPLHYNATNGRWENYNRDMGPWTTGNSTVTYSTNDTKVAIGKSTHSGTYNLEIDGIFNSLYQITLGDGSTVGPSWFLESTSLLTEDYTIPTTYDAEARVDTAVYTDVTLAIPTGSKLTVSDTVTSP